MEARLAASDRSSGPTTGISTKNRVHLGKHSRKSGGPPPSSASSNQHVLKNGGGTGWNWEVILGGTGVLTPKQFIANLQNLADYSWPTRTRLTAYMAVTRKWETNFCTLHYCEHRHPSIHMSSHKPYLNKNNAFSISNVGQKQQKTTNANWGFLTKLP